VAIEKLILLLDTPVDREPVLAGMPSGFIVDPINSEARTYLACNDRIKNPDWAVYVVHQKPSNQIVLIADPSAVHAIRRKQQSRILYAAATQH
jgi:hypothetical protein